MNLHKHKNQNRDEQPEMKKNDMLNDPRFDLLLKDIKRFAPRMDTMAIRDVLSALKVIDHKYYTIFRAAYNPLMKLPLPDVGTMIDISDCFRWAGYYDHPFFDRY